MTVTGIVEPKPMVGWICPACNGGVSPYCQRCPCVDRVTISFGNSVPVDNCDAAAFDWRQILITNGIVNVET